MPARRLTNFGQPGNEIAAFRVILPSRTGKGGHPMKAFHCGSLVPGCEWHTRAEDEAEVMRRAVEHLREAHGEDTIRETMIEAIRSRIEKVRDAA
jgi:predicted small metal-binding protein